MRNQYTISEFLTTAYALVVTKIFYKGARLIRRPFYIRGKKSFIFGSGLTTGHACRFDLDGTKQTLFIGKNCEIGDNVHIVAHQKVTIGENCLMASKIFISDTNHGTYDNSDPHSDPNTAPNDRRLVTKPISIGNNVWIGENVVVLLGVTIGDGCIIGANSVVNRDIPAGTIAAGSPARVIKTYDYCNKKWMQNSCINDEK